MAGVVNLPDSIIKNIISKIPKQFKVCFLSAFIVGLTAHMYKITNWIPNWDSLVFRHDPQNMISLGRWFLPIVCNIGSLYDLPWINGFLSIVLTSLGASLICLIFNVRKPVTAALIGAATVTFPTVTSVLLYNYVADGYSMTFFLSCLAALLMTKKKPRYIAAAILIALSAAIYQAYISVTVMLLLLWLIDRLIFKKDSVIFSLKKGAKFMGTGILGMSAYYAVLMVLLKITGTHLLDYQGIGEAMSFSAINIKDALYVCIHTFFNYFFDFSEGIAFFPILNIIIVAATFVMYAVSVTKRKLFKDPARLFLLALYVILLPAAANILAFANSTIEYHNLMKMGYFVFYMYFILLYERMNFLKIRQIRIKCCAVFIITCIMIFNQIIIANICYHKLQLSYEKSYGLLMRIIDRIEQTDNSEVCREILIVGALPGSEAYSVNLPPDMTGATDGYILRKDDESVGQSVLCSAINDYSGKNYSFIYGERKKEMLKSERVKSMSRWPDKNSVTAQDGIIVIKLSESDK